MTSQTQRRKRVVSGMRSTGKLHLGNYVGALQNWVHMQDEYECFFFVADWHALTTDYADTSQVKQNSIEVLLDWLAAGLDPERCVMFIQSHVPQHAELHLLLSMITPLGWLERVPTYKEQRENIAEKDLSTYGFLGYPVLQAADILLYKGAHNNELLVPVGEDQVAHVELTREIARRFNLLYHADRPIGYAEAKAKHAQQGISSAATSFGEMRGVFPEPQALKSKAAKLPGTDGRKMSKSYGNTILLTDPEPVVRQKLQGMVNDPARAKRTDRGNPDVCPVGDLHKIFSGTNVIAAVDTGCRSAGISCVECKGWAADSLVQLLRPMQEKRKLYEDDPASAWIILEQGSQKARKVADATMLEVRDAMGLSQDFSAPTRELRTSQENAGKLTFDPGIWTLPRLERGNAIRAKWISSLPSEIILRDIGSRTFLTSKGKRVGLPTSREKHDNEWTFKPRDRHYDVLVLLCLNKCFELFEFVLPQKILQPNWKKFQRNNDGKVILLVKRNGGNFVLGIPDENSLPITEFQFNRKPLY